MDSAFRVEGTDSNFRINLNETINVEDGRLRLDKISFVNSFYTVTEGMNQYIYFYDPQNLQTWFALPEQAYTGGRLANTIQVTTGYSASYYEPRNQIRIAMPNELTTVQTDEQLRGQGPRWLCHQLGRGRLAVESHEHQQRARSSEKRRQRYRISLYQHVCVPRRLFAEL